MKRFIVSILCVSVFFIGLGSLVEKAGARFKSDPRALEIIKQARQAIGGEAAIANVKSMTIIGASTHTFNIDGVAQSEAGSLEINFELPTNKFGKMSRVGNPDQLKAHGEFNEEIDFVVVRKMDEKPLLKNENGDALTVGDKKIILKKADGTTEEINTGEKKIFVRKMGEGEAHFRTDNGELVNIDDKKVLLERTPFRAEFGGVRQNELLRTTFALLLTAPEGTEATYIYAGEGNVDGYSCDIIEVQSAGTNFKLFLDKSSRLPRMLSYQGMKPVMVKVDKIEGGVKEKRTLMREDFPRPETAEYQIKFSDFRSVNGVQLPHRWTQTIGGNPSENTDITSYEINPVNIAEKFQNRKVRMRTEKTQ